jgi:hypothetical protein
MHPSMVIEPFVLLIALLPLAAYLTLFGLIRLSGRAMVTTGGRDTFAIAIAISGLVAVGPAELFFPEAAAAAFGIAIWPVLVFLYFLLVTLVILSSRPRLVIYGRGVSALASPLLRAAQSIDPQAECDESAGQISLPGAGIHLRIDGFRGADTAEVFAYEGSIVPSFWHRLRAALQEELSKEEAVAQRRGGMTFVVGAAMLVLISVQLFVAHDQVVQGFQEWLWR